MLPAVSDDRIDKLVEGQSILSTKLDFMVESQKRMDEILNGTHDHGGLKERMAIQEEETKKNKQSWDTVISRISIMETNLQITLKNYEERIMQMLPITQAVKWVGVTLGALVLGLLWAVLTGRVQLVFK